MPRSPIAAWLAWLPRVLAAATFASLALLAPTSAASPAFASLAGTADPLSSILAHAFALLPVGTPAYRLALAAAAAAALATYLVTTLVAEAGKDDAATAAGAAAAGLLTATCAPFVLAGSHAGSASWLAAAIAATLLLGHRVALGAGAGAGLGAALLLGLAIAIDATAIPILFPLAVLYALRLRRGARWPLATPTMLVLAVTAGLAQPLLRAASGRAASIDHGAPHSVAALAAAHTPALHPAGPLAPWLESGADALGPLGIAAAAVGVIALFSPRSRWLAIAILTAAASAVVAEVAAHRPAGAVLAASAAILVGAGVARVARTIAIPAGQAAIGGALALIIAGSAALTTAHALGDVADDRIAAPGP